MAWTGSGQECIAFGVANPLLEDGCVCSAYAPGSPWQSHSTEQSECKHCGPIATLYRSYHLHILRAPSAQLTRRRLLESRLQLLPKPLQPCGNNAWQLEAVLAALQPFLSWHERR